MHVQELHNTGILLTWLWAFRFSMRASDLKKAAELASDRASYTFREGSFYYSPLCPSASFALIREALIHLQWQSDYVGHV